MQIDTLTVDSNVVTFVVSALQCLGVADGTRTNNEQCGLLLVGGQVGGTIYQCGLFEDKE